MANEDVRQLLVLTLEKPASSAGFRSALRAGVGAVMSPLYPASFSTPCVTPLSPRIPLLHTPRKNAPQPRRAAGPGCLSIHSPVRPHRANQAGNRLSILTWLRNKSLLCHLRLECVVVFLPPLRAVFRQTQTHLFLAVVVHLFSHPPHFLVRERIAVLLFRSI